MRKNLLFGASMLLLALVSCTREKDILPADGFVKMRFTAVVDDGSTRTAYENDKTASWVAGDAISVYVTNGTDGQVATFTAGEDLTFEGDVPAGYTTIVAGAYPADAAHTFDANGVKTLNLPASRTLAEGVDPASVLPLVGTFADGVMTFHHPFGALKFTIDDVPATAVRFRFTTFGHRVSGSYAPDDELEDTLADAEKSMDIVFPAAEGSRSFYVPLPAGELYPESVIALYDAEGNLLFQKVAPQAITVTKNVIKRIAAVGSWKKNEEWQATYLYDKYNTTQQAVYSYVKLSGMTGFYDFTLSSKSSFNSRYGSIEGFLASNYIPNKKAGGATPKSEPKNYYYSKLTPGGSYVMVIYGLDENYNFTGEYNLIDIEIPEFVTPEGWSLEFNPFYTLSSGEVHPAVHVQIPEGTTWATANMKKETFLANYGGDVAAFIWAQRTSTSTIRTSMDINLYFSSLDETDYVYIVYGVNERTEEGADRTFTYEYCLLEYTYTKPSDEPTEAYLAWIGQWSVDDGTNTDTWTISAKENNVSYSIVGLIGKTSASYTVTGTFNYGKGDLSISSQKDIGTVRAKMSDGNSYDASVGLYGKKTSSGSFTTGTYSLLHATLDSSNPDAGTLSPAGSTYLYYTFCGSYVNAAGESKWAGFGTRPANATMTRINADEAPRPDGMEDEDFVTTVFPAETVEAVPAE